MKFYLYISDAKVDMLLPQVPHELKKKVAFEFKLDLKLISASRRSETEGTDDRIARLEAVVSFIRETCDVGSVETPREYVEDTLPMKWGPYGWRNDSPVVYFGAATETTVVGLGGSMKHVMGSTGPASADSQSFTPILLSFLERQFESELEKHRTESGGAEGTKLDKDEAEMSLGAVALASIYMRGPKQNLNFLAKRLLFGRSEPHAQGRSVLLATPLYVALAE